MFFRQDRKEDSFIRKGQVLERIKAEFASQLAAVPSGADSRNDDKWIVHPPNFVRKVGQRIFWSSRIVVETEARKVTALNYWSSFRSALAIPEERQSVTVLLRNLATPWAESGSSLGTTLPGSYPKWTVTHKGTDTYEISWSCQVTTSKELRQPRVEEITHKGTDWEAVAS